MPDQEPCLHLALAFDVDDAASFQQELVIEMLIGVLRHLNLARLTRRFHTRSYIHSIASHVVEKIFERPRRLPPPGRWQCQSESALCVLVDQLGSSQRRASQARAAPELGRDRAA